MVLFTCHFVNQIWAFFDLLYLRPYQYVILQAAYRFIINFLIISLKKLQQHLTISLALIMHLLFFCQGQYYISSQIHEQYCIVTVKLFYAGLLVACKVGDYSGSSI